MVLSYQDRIQPFVSSSKELKAELSGFDYGFGIAVSSSKELKEIFSVMVISISLVSSSKELKAYQGACGWGTRGTPVSSSKELKVFILTPPTPTHTVSFILKGIERLR